MASVSEEAEVSSSMPTVMGLVLHMTVGATLLFYVLYKMQVDTNLGAQLIPMGIPSGEQSFNGVSSVFLILLPILFALLTIYIIQTKLPGIFKDEERIKALIGFVQGTIIPLGAVVFFSLMVYQFLNGPLGGASAGALMLFTLTIFAVIALAFFIRISVMPGGGTNGGTKGPPGPPSF
jgi:hypothetical protein